MMPTYTIGTEGNGYFNGRDAVLYKDGERVAKIALKDNRPAVYVKVYSWGTDATKDLRADLGDDKLEEIEEGLRQDFWWHLADEAVQEFGYEEAFSSGRSGGWCVPTTARDRTWHWWEETTIDAPIPEHESTDDLSQTDARKLWFFQAAEQITAEVEHLRTEGFDQAVMEAHDELESKRNAVLIRGDN